MVYALRSGDFSFFKEKKWACTGLLAYAGAALFAACRPHYSIGTYAMWVVPPMTYLAAAPLQAFPKIADRRKRWLSRHRLIFGLVLILLFATIDGARHVNMVRAIRGLPRSLPDWNPRIAKDAPHSPGELAKVNVKDILARFVAPAEWRVGDNHMPLLLVTSRRHA